MWKDGWGQNVSLSRQMNFFCQNGKVETGPSCVKSIHVNIWFQWNHAKTESDCPGISLWFNQETIHKVRIWKITVSSGLQWSKHWNWRGHTVSKNVCIEMYTIMSNNYSVGLDRFNQAAAWHIGLLKNGIFSQKFFIAPEKNVRIKVVVTKEKYIFVTEILSRKYSNWLFRRIKFRFPSWFRHKDSVVRV